MLQYYLLMRSTGRLALEYKASIDGQGCKRVTDIHYWSSRGGAKSRTGCEKNKGPTLVLEGLGSSGGNVLKTNMMASLDSNDYNQQPVHASGVGNPFVRRYAGELRSEW
ncbi:hypothetical protein FRC08_015462 [Ceratobasidium sp. 394]|nr:hypothetical protein FRC08_015462 [Ceratobasidium sp. 394]